MIIIPGRGCSLKAAITFSNNLVKLSKNSRTNKQKAIPFTLNRENQDTEIEGFSDVPFTV